MEAEHGLLAKLLAFLRTATTVMKAVYRYHLAQLLASASAKQEFENQAPLRVRDLSKLEIPKKKWLFLMDFTPEVTLLSATIDNQGLRVEAASREFNNRLGEFNNRLGEFNNTINNRFGELNTTFRLAAVVYGLTSILRYLK